MLAKLSDAERHASQELVHDIADEEDSSHHGQSVKLLTIC